jgi:transcriptional regulator with XRE-family HTH domain
MFKTMVFSSVVKYLIDLFLDLKYDTREREVCKMAKSKSADYNGTFASVLRALLEHHPVHGGKTTYGNLGAVLGVKPQSISQWANGDTTPDMKHIVPLARFFNVDCNYLLTGVSSENQTVWQDLGLHENSVRFLKDLKKLADRKELNSMAMILITDLFFRSGALTRFYDMVNQYVYDRIEASETFERDKLSVDELVKSDADDAEILRAVNRLRAHETNAELIWYKAAFRAREVMEEIVQYAGGFEEFEERILQSRGRVEVVPKGLEDLSTGTTIYNGEVRFAEE